ncbi:hypothetical protein SLS60_011569 [Paraconiothyrium brasiliense]|uniref:C6 transcription factor n=1 Tax=Paraconiothyrium brasiliense TaxID=300254 RepID=A0ABR3QIK4_9PLEO
MRIVCPGYRDPSEQTFRDESVKVKRKAQEAYSKKAARIKGNRDDVFPNDSLVVLPLNPNETRIVLPQWSPGPPIEDVALAHFMSSYVPESRFEYLLSIYTTFGPDASLPAAIEAASKARLAWEVGEPLVMEEARSSYAKAVTETNLALSNPATALQDATLVSVLLLSLFETMIWTGVGIPDNWTTHIRGALSLVRLRGSSQLETEVGCQLFTHVTNIVSVSSIRLCERIPQDIIELQIEALRQHDDKRPIYRLTSYTGEVANLFAEIAEGNLTTNKIIESTRRMDDKYMSFLETLSPIWRCRNVVQDDPEVYGRLFHQYPRPRTAQIWNSIRMTRMLLNGIIYGHASLLSGSSAAAIKAQAERNVGQMAADICATVSQFLDTRTFNVAWAATLLWPLSSVRGATLVPEDLRDYAEQTLKRLGRKLRMPSAEAVAFHPELRALEDGLHMFYLS